jgi:microcystin degradation protein MlrC
LIGTGRDACILDVQGIKAVILNSRRSFICMKDFEDIGLAPLDYKIVIVKLGYLYPELRDIAPVHLMALTSGFCNLDMRRLPFTQVNRPVYPLDLDMIWEP